MRYITNLIAFLSVATPLMANAQGGPGGPPATVEVVAAAIARLAPTVSVPGTVLSRDDARLAAEVAGNIVEIADIGARVAEGDVVAKIQDALLVQQRAENEGLVASRVARIGFLEREVQRLRKLAAQNVAAASLLDQNESELAIARSDLQVARARLAQIGIALSRTEVRAPFAGRITQRFVNPGEHVAVGAEVARLVGTERVEIIARAPLRSVSYLAEGGTLPVMSERRNGDGAIRAIVPFGDARSHMFEMRIDVPSEDWIIGESVRITVPTSQPQELLAVPRDALVLRSDGTSVFRVRGETAERIPVVTGAGDGERIAVSGGDLSVGDLVVVRGAERLRPGQSVNIARGPASAAAAAGS